MWFMFWQMHINISQLGHKMHFVSFDWIDIHWSLWNRYFSSNFIYWMNNALRGISYSYFEWISNNSIWENKLNTILRISLCEWTILKSSDTHKKLSLANFMAPSYNTYLWAIICSLYSSSRSFSFRFHSFSSVINIKFSAMKNIKEKYQVYRRRLSYVIKVLCICLAFMFYMVVHCRISIEMGRVSV